MKGFWYYAQRLVFFRHGGSACSTTWPGVPSSGLLSAVAAGGAKATALNPSQARPGGRADPGFAGTLRRGEE